MAPEAGFRVKEGQERPKIRHVRGAPQVYPGFHSFALKALLPGREAPCQLFMEAASRQDDRRKLVVFFQKGDPVKADWLDHSLGNGINQGFVNRNHLDDLQDYFFQAARDLAKDQAAPLAKRTATFYEGAMCTVKSAMVDPRNSRRLAMGVGQVKSLVDSLWEDEHFRQALLKVMAADQSLFVHSVNVCLLGVSLARILGWPRQEVEALAVGLMFQDLGMCYLPEEMLNSGRTLAAEEKETVEKHPRLSRSFLSQVPGVSEEALTVVLCHHENIDGTGYPRGMAGHKLLRTSRLARIVDVYDAMTSDRSWRGANTPFDALKLMKDQMGLELDQEIFHALVKLLGRVENTSV